MSERFKWLTFPVFAGEHAKGLGGNIALRPPPPGPDRVKECLSAQDIIKPKIDPIWLHHTAGQGWLAGRSRLSPQPPTCRGVHFSFCPPPAPAGPQRNKVSDWLQKKNMRKGREKGKIFSIPGKKINNGGGGLSTFFKTLQACRPWCGTRSWRWPPSGWLTSASSSTICKGNTQIKHLHPVFTQRALCLKKSCEWTQNTKNSWYRVLNLIKGACVTKKLAFLAGHSAKALTPSP